MEINNNSVLILEDDVTLGAAMKEAFERSGVSAVHVTKPSDALNAIEGARFNYIFIDCMLPGANGADFVEKTLRIQHPKLKAKIYLMSGIYIEKSYIAEALKKTLAVGFLQKPFSIIEIVNIVKSDIGQNASAVSPQSVNSSFSARKKLYGMFSDSKVTPRKKRKIIEEIEEISGFDLPFIYSLLVESNSSGNLFIYHDGTSVSSITFCNGHITGVDTEDKSTYLGEMLIQSGYATPQDVQAALREKSTRRIGQQLIMQNQLSPHAFDLILGEQMNIRLSRTIIDEKVKINFAISETEMIYPNIESETLNVYLHDWIASKLNLKWLKALYNVWLDNTIEVGPAFDENSQALNLNLVKSLDGIFDILKQGFSLNKILHMKTYNEEALYKALHFLLTKGYIVFAQKLSAQTIEEKREQLGLVHKELVNKSISEVYQYIEQSTLASNSAEAMYQEFMTVLGEKPEDEELQKTWNFISKIVSEATIRGFDSQSKEAMLQEKAKIEVDAKLKANKYLEELKVNLASGKYLEASKLVKMVLDLYSGAFQIRIYSVWVKIAMLDPSKKLIQLKDIEVEIAQIPAEEKYDSLYPFVLGLLYKVKGDVNNARKSFEKSIALDNSFILSRRELALLESAHKKQDIMKMDLKDVVSGFFKKK